MKYKMLFSIFLVLFISFNSASSLAVPIKEVEEIIIPAEERELGIVHLHYLGSSLIATVDNQNEVLYYYPDALQSVRATVNPENAGELNTFFKYLPFGELISSNVPVFLGFLGKEYDSETETYEVGIRQYLPSIGRFLSPDTLITAPYNRYVYALNNPFRYKDPRGTEGEEVLGVPGDVLTDTSGAGGIDEFRLTADVNADAKSGTTTDARYDQESGPLAANNNPQTTTVEGGVNAQYMKEVSSGVVVGVVGRVSGKQDISHDVMPDMISGGLHDVQQNSVTMSGEATVQTKVADVEVGVSRTTKTSEGKVENPMKGNAQATKKTKSFITISKIFGKNKISLRHENTKYYGGDSDRTLSDMPDSYTYDSSPQSEASSNSLTITHIAGGKFIDKASFTVSREDITPAGKINPIKYDGVSVLLTTGPIYKGKAGDLSTQFNYGYSYNEHQGSNHNYGGSLIWTLPFKFVK